MPSATTNGERKIMSYWPGVVLFCLSLFVALLCYKDYGKSWDENIQRQIGTVTYSYVFEGNNELKTYDARRYGSGFELPLIIMEKKLHLEDSRDICLARHLATHIFFLLAVFCGYVLACRVFKSQLMGCLFFLVLILNPRIYAHSFFNTKDLPFLSAFLIALLLSQVAFEKNKFRWFLLLGVACGYTTSIRASGILLVPAIGLFLFIDLLNSISLKEKTGRTVGNTLFFLAGFCGMLYLAWPELWGKPVANFIESFRTLATLPWYGHVLFNGTNYPGDQLPWNYNPVWFAITTPELWLLAGIAGFIWVCIAFVKKPLQYLQNTNERNFLLYIILFIGPVIPMTLLHGINIDDWRHLYFIYPPFVMLVLLVVNKLAAGKKKWVIYGLCILQIGDTCFFMVKYHPYQQVYFNHLISHDKEYLRKHYDLEYWGCAYTQGLDYILANDKSDTIRLYLSLYPVKNAVSFLPIPVRKRVLMVDSTDHPDYFITNFRNHPDDYDYPETLYNIDVLNSTIIRVYKMHK